LSTLAQRRSCFCVFAILFYTLASHQAVAAVAISSLTASSPSPQPVGTPVAWTASASDTDPGTLLYRFSVQSPGAARAAIVRDFHPSNFLFWAPISGEGAYVVTVTVLNSSTRLFATDTAPFSVTSLVPGTWPVLIATPNPLVALYSAPPCPAGNSFVVLYRLQGTSNPYTATSTKRCSGTASMNVYVAGLLPNTPYQFNHKISSVSGSIYGPTVSFTTGAIPGYIKAATPPTSIIRPIDSQTSLADSILLLDYISPALGTGFVRMPMATDLNGNTLWYYPSLFQVSRYFLRPIAGGTMLIHLDDPSVTVPSTDFQASQILREFDLAGNTIRETNVTQVARLLAVKYPAWNICAWTSDAGCRRGQTPVVAFSHEAIRLPNGYTATLLTAEKLYTDGTQGSSVGHPSDVLGDILVVLDQDFQVVWAWNSYLSLDVTRPAVLNETCTPFVTRCSPYLFMPNAFDWTHCNSINYVPSDGSLLVSIRNQDWIVKIDYANGTGTGNVLWRLGQFGDFTITGTTDPWPWFSHQHHAGFDVPGSNLLSVFDNGNTRVAPAPVGLGGGNSRGMVLSIDEVNRIVSPTLSVDLARFSVGGGSAQLLTNGNYSFDAGGINGLAKVFSQSIEVVPGIPPAGTLNYTQQETGSVYRSYRMPNLYVGAAK
jgi:arylsulfate sulfotransferase